MITSRCSEYLDGPSAEDFRRLYMNQFPPDPQEDPAAYSDWKGDQDVEMLLKYFGPERVIDEMISIMKEMLDFESVMMVVAAQMKFKADRGEYSRKAPPVRGRTVDWAMHDEIDLSSQEFHVKRDPFTGRNYATPGPIVDTNRDGGRTDRPHDHLCPDNTRRKPR